MQALAAELSGWRRKFRFFGGKHKKQFTGKLANR
jgi:hypothetical protein